MIVKEAHPAQKAQGKEASPGTEEAVEAAHLAGSAVMTGVVAAALTIIAIPASIGLGIIWTGKVIARRMRGK